jgi:hypothetical protein
MGAPVLVGAGIGAVTSLAMGKDPLMGAAMGGLTGGTFGGSGALGSGFTEFSSAIPDAVGSQALTDGVTGAAFDQAVMNPAQYLDETMPISELNALPTGFNGVQIPDSALMSTDQLMSGVGDIQPQLGFDTGFGVNVGQFTQPVTDIGTANTANLLGAPQQSFLEKIQSIPNPLLGMSPVEQTQLGMMGIDAFSPEEQQQMQGQLGQIRPSKQPNVGQPLAINMPSRTFKPRFA